MTCPYCGAVTATSARFCSACGRALTAPGAPPPPTGFAPPGAPAPGPEQPTTRLAAPAPLPPMYSPPPVYHPAPLAVSSTARSLEALPVYQVGPARDPSA